MRCPALLISMTLMLCLSPMAQASWYGLYTSVKAKLEGEVDWLAFQRWNATKQLDPRAAFPRILGDGYVIPSAPWNTTKAVVRRWDDPHFGLPQTSSVFVSPFMHWDVPTGALQVTPMSVDSPSSRTQNR